MRNVNVPEPQVSNKIQLSYYTGIDAINDGIIDGYHICDITMNDNCGFVLLKRFVEI